MLVNDAFSKIEDSNQLVSFSLRTLYLRILVSE